MAHHHRAKGDAVNGDEEKPWDLEDEFKYAPKRPEDDPWKILFDSLAEKEKTRCDVWTNEIQNLLLFAGLFSGLVTAFLLQSYKSLQPDPNADIISLLQVIASSVNNANNSVSSIANPLTHLPLPPLPSSSFSASSPTVRLNICWFISLILTLTVALFGMIVRQWLHAHQSFTGQLSSRDMLAILNMRIDALEHWRVDEIIKILPLILSVALVVFFVGMVQFLQILGDRTLLIMVTTIISISLTLFYFSIVLPSTQCLTLYLWPSRQDLPLPSPCPYKSPQSGIFQATCFYLFRFLIPRDMYHYSSIIRSMLNRENKYALMHPIDIWSKRTWAEVDLCWLSVRQACVLPESDGYHQFIKDHNLPPLLDISKTFRYIVEGAGVSPDMLAAAYYCFHEVATPFFPGNNPHRKVIIHRDELDEVFNMINRRNQFLQSQLSFDPSSFSSDAPTYVFHDRSSFEFETVHTRKQFFTNISILHHHNLFAFTNLLKNYHHAKGFFHHRLELGLRLSNALFAGAHHTKHVLHYSLPPYLRGELFDQHRWKLLKNDVPIQIIHQYALALTTFFDNAAHPHHRISDSCLMAHQDTADLVEKTAWDMFRIVTEQSLAKYSKEDRKKVVSIFGQVLERMSVVFTAPGAAVDGSNENGVTNGNAEERQLPENPVKFLFLAAIYIRRLNSYRINHQIETCMDPSAVIALDDAISALLSYKRHVLDTSQTAADNELEVTHLNAKDRFGGVDRFSEKWWKFLEGDHDLFCEDSVGSLYTSLPPGPRALRVSTLRNVSTMMRSGLQTMLPSLSTGMRGSLPQYSKKNEDCVFPQAELPTMVANSSSSPIQSPNSNAEEQDTERIPVSATSRPIDDLPPGIYRPASDIIATPAASTTLESGRFRSISFSFPNNMMSDDPYSSEVDKH